MDVTKVNQKLLEFSEAAWYHLPFYSETFLQCNVAEKKDIPTACAWVSIKGMNIGYNDKFITDMPQKEVNFVALHELFHLLFNHSERGKMFNHMVANIAMDMIINSILNDQIQKSFATPPTIQNPAEHKLGDEWKGRNIVVFIPKEYTGPEIFEYLYEWLMEQYQKHKQKKQQQGDKQDQQQQQQQSGGGQDEQQQDSEKDNQKKSGKGGSGKSGNNPDYGPFGKNDAEMASLDKLMDNMAEAEKNSSQCVHQLDEHVEDDVNPELRKKIIDDVIQGLRSRGLVKGDIEETLKRLQKARHNYLKEIKKAIEHLQGVFKNTTWTRPSRRSSAFGLKGWKKNANIITVIQDTSGSMCGYEDKVMSYIYQNDIAMQYIQQDANETPFDYGVITSKKQLQKVKIHGGGGTVLQPAIDYVKKNYPRQNLLILTDGYTDELDFSGFGKRVLVLTVDKPIPTKGKSNLVRQITVSADK